jgi:hypothetical protein
MPQRETLARLRHVSEQVSLWDELDTMQLLPGALRPWVPEPSVGCRPSSP